MTTLVSWLDPRYDFVQKHSTEVKTDGINFHLHQHCFDGIDRHVLLYMEIAPSKNPKQDTELKSPLPDDQARAFRKAVAGHFSKREVELRKMIVHDPLSLSEIERMSLDALKSLPHDEEVLLFLNPGYQMCQLAWFLCHQSGEFPTRIVQMRQGQFTQSGKPELIGLEVKRSQSAHTLMIQDAPLYRGPAKTEQIYLTPQIRAVYDRAEAAAFTTNLPVLITGQSGTGKEWLAKDIAENGRNGSYKALNCAAFNDELLRSEVFGHVRGAFTGAVTDKKGLIEEAKGGTLFLDEIGEASPFVQQALLRVLQDGSYYRVGENVERKAQVRIVAATNRPLLQAAQAGKFRLDLFYRLAVVRLHLPSWQELPLPEREEMLDHQIGYVAEISGKAKSLVFSKEARRWLLTYEMPGNFRQLDNLLKALYAFYGDEPEITVALLQRELQEELGLSVNKSLSDRWEDAEKAHIERVLPLYNGNLTHSAKAMGYAINTLKKKIKDYGIGGGRE